jgi:hypothetical protein
MLEIELDIFSGMPNPTWTLSGAEEDELIERVMADPAQLSPVATEDEQFSLGYRGVLVRLVKTDDAAWSKARLTAGRSVPLAFRVGSKPAAAEAPIADWLLQTSESRDIGVSDEVRAVAAKGVSVVGWSWAGVDPTQASYTAPAGAD